MGGVIKERTHHSSSNVSVLPTSVSPTYCEQCGHSEQFFTVAEALRLTGASRSTVYEWMRRGWLHWEVLASGHRLICRESLGKFIGLIGSESLSSCVRSKRENCA